MIEIKLDWSVVIRAVEALRKQRNLDDKNRISLNDFGRAYNCVIKYGPMDTYILKFENEEEATWFVLKWS